MANQILIKFKPSGHEELIKAIQKLSTVQKKLTDSVKKVDTASSKAAKSAGVLGTRNQRLSETNSKLANSFATIRSKMLLWSFAMSLGIRQIAQMAQEAANLKGMETAFNTLAGGTENATVAIDKLRGATNNTMSDFDLFQQANNAMILGVSKNSDEMAEMFDIAQRLGNALGKDTRMSVESLITGIGRQSRMMLDNIGIIVKSEEAYEAHAKVLGKSAEDLTDLERKQAFLNATMESARAKVAKLNTETDTARTSFQELGAATKNLEGRLGDAANAFIPLVDNMTKFLVLVTDERIDRFIRSFKLIVDIIKVVAVVGGVLFVAAFASMFGVMATVTAGVGLLTSAFIYLTSSWIGGIALGGSVTYGLLSITDAISAAINPTIELTEEQKRLNKEFLEGADTLADLDTGFSYETLAEEMLRYASSIETVTNALYFQMLAQDIIRDMHGKTHQGQLDAIDTQLATIDAIATEIGMTSKLGDVQDMLLEKKKNLIKAEAKRIEQSKKVIKVKKTEIEMITERAVASASADENIAKSAIKAAGQQIKAYIATATAKVMLDKLTNIPYPFNLAAAAMAGTIVGALAQGVINTAVNLVPTFEQGGMVGGRRHSQGGTMIEAEQGEFVMSRNAVDAIGTENLNRMNQGGGGAVNITFTGNVMSQDFIENEAIPQIKDAIRRGADIGVS